MISLKLTTQGFDLVTINSCPFQREPFLTEMNLNKLKGVTALHGIYIVTVCFILTLGGRLCERAAFVQ